MSDDHENEDFVMLNFSSDEDDTCGSDTSVDIEFEAMRPKGPLVDLNTIRDKNGVVPEWVRKTQEFELKFNRTRKVGQLVRRKVRITRYLRQTLGIEESALQSHPSTKEIDAKIKIAAQEAGIHLKRGFIEMYETDQAAGNEHPEGSKIQLSTEISAVSIQDDQMC